MQTIITNQCHICVFIFFWHKTHCNLLVVISLILFHVNNWFFANWTSYISINIFFCTFWMHCMATFKNSGWKNRMMHICLTNRTIHLKPSFFTLMIIFHFNAIATSTFIAVKLRFTAPNSTYSTLMTMVNSLFVCIIIIKCTNFAVIFRKVF